MSLMDLPHWKRFLSSLKPGQVFTARQVIPFGDPDTIYKRLSRLVKSGFLVRVGFGIYMRRDRRNPDYLPQVEEIALAKNKAFGRTAITHEKNLVNSLRQVPLSEVELLINGSGGLEPIRRSPPQAVPEPVPEQTRDRQDDAPPGYVQTTKEFFKSIFGNDDANKEDPALVYDVNSSTSQFRTVRGLVRLKRVNARKLTLADTKIGQVLRAWWSLGIKGLSEYELLQGYKLLGRSERKELKRHAGLVPNWLNRLITVGDLNFVVEYARGP
jgi:hypothetical protein